MGKDLFARDPGECCRLRKVAPLGKSLRGYSAWVTGLRRSDAPTRANAPLVSFDEGYKLVKINPLATWTDDDMQDYIDEHDVLVNPLVYEGYPSIVAAPAPPRGQGRRPAQRALATSNKGYKRRDHPRADRARKQGSTIGRQRARRRRQRCAHAARTGRAVTEHDK